MKTTLNNIEAKMIDFILSLTGYAFYLTSNMNDAKDLVQETCIKALSNKEKFAAETNMKAWLYTIMRNTFINDYRRKARSAATFSNDVNEFILNNKLAERGPESDYNYKELTGFVNALSPELRIPFQMHEDGFKYEEIAEELGLKLGTVKSRIHYSRRKLMDIINR